MRVQLQENIDEGTKFAKMLFEIGEGRTQKINGTNEIKISENLGKVVDNINALISKVYPDIKNLENKTSEWLCDRSILKVNKVKKWSSTFYVGAEGYERVTKSAAGRAAALEAAR